MKSKLIISKNLSQKVNYLHSVHGKVEWSGALLFSVEEGDITNPSKLVLKAQDLYLMDVGSSAYTEYEMGAEITKLYAKFPEADLFKCADKGVLPWRVGQIHTHHNMGAFFSPTDEKELRTNAPNHSYYLSLIVDWKCEYKARIGIYGSVEEEKTYLWKDGSGNDIRIPTKNKSEKVFEIECDIEFEDVDDLSKRIEEIKKAKVTRVPKNAFPLFNRGEKASAKPIDISPRQQELVPKTEFVSEKAISKYITALVSCGTNRKFKDLDGVISFVDSSNEEEFAMWEDLVWDSAENIFYEMFDGTLLSHFDIAERCIDAVEKNASSRNEHSKCIQTLTNMFEIWLEDKSISEEEDFYYGGYK